MSFFFFSSFFLFLVGDEKGVRKANTEDEGTWDIRKDAGATFPGFTGIGSPSQPGIWQST